MSASRSSAFTALVVGGSVGGLSAALELRSIGADVTVFERSAGQIEARGAGVVMQPEVADLLQRIGSSAEAVSVPLQTRQRLDRAGQVHTFPAPQLMTSWGALYATLRGSLASDVPYLLGRELTDVRQSDGRAHVRFADGQTADGDLLIGADGVGSAVRRSVRVPGETAYSGYVAWRGLEPESSLPAHIVDLLDDSFTFFAVPGLQFLSYLVPGPHGETRRGARQVNWVWYTNVGAAGQRQALLGASGTRYRAFLPPGEARPPVLAALHRLAEEKLPPILRELVAESQVFLQPVADVPHTRLRAGRTVLIGDAAGTVRPHTASGTSKAFGDAHLLAQAVTGWTAAHPFPDEALARWEQQRGHALAHIARAGRELASNSVLGHKPQYLHDLATLDDSNTRQES